MKNLGIIFCCDVVTRETFCLSREVDGDDDKKTIYEFLKNEAMANDDEVDTILVVRSGEETTPEVKDFWRAANGDFDF